MKQTCRKRLCQNKVIFMFIFVFFVIILQNKLSNICILFFKTRIMRKVTPVKLYFAKLYVTGVNITRFSMYRKVAPLKGLRYDPSVKKRGVTNVLLFSAQYLIIGSMSGVIVKVSFFWLHR